MVHPFCLPPVEPLATTDHFTVSIVLPFSYYPSLNHIALSAWLLAISLKHSPYTVLKCPGVQRLLVTVLLVNLLYLVIVFVKSYFPHWTTNVLLLWIILFPRLREEVRDGGEKSQMCASDPVLSKAGGELISYPGNSPGNPTRQPQMYPVWGEGVWGQGGDYKIN